MKQFKNGKIIDVPAEQVQKVQRHLDKARAAQQSRQPISIRDLEKRVKALEEAVAALTAKEEAVEVVESVEAAEALAE